MRFKKLIAAISAAAMLLPALPFIPGTAPVAEAATKNADVTITGAAVVRSTTTDKTYDFTPSVDRYAQFNFELCRVKAGDTMTVSNIYVTTDVEQHTVTFNSNGGSAVSAQKVFANETATEPAAPTREGCTFDGWLLNGAAYDFSTPVTGDITLTASWKSNTGDTLSEE